MVAHPTEDQVSHPRANPFRDRVMALLKSRKNGATARQLAALLGEPYDPVMQCMNGLRGSNKIERCGRDAHSGEQRYRIRAEQPKAPPAVGLPMLQPGRGDRRTDCKNIGACLQRWVDSDARGDAHCPKDCPHYVTASREQKLAAGMRGGDRGLG